MLRMGKQVASLSRMMFFEEQRYDLSIIFCNFAAENSLLIFCFRWKQDAVNFHSLKDLLCA